MKLTREMLPKLAGLLVAVPAVVMVCNLHWFFVRAPNAVGFDDGYTVSLGERIIDGHWLPYVDGCSHRGPLLYWLVALSLKLTGRFNWAGPRWMMMLFSLATVAGLTGTGFAARLPLAGAIGSLFFVFIALVQHEADSGFAVTGEAISGAFGIVALCFCAWALMSAKSRRSRLVLLALSGFSVSLAGFTKQTAFPIVAPLGLWVLAYAFSLENTALRERLILVAALVGGFLAPALIIVARYLIAGQLGTFWYWFFTYNAKVYMAPYKHVPYINGFDGYMRAHPWFFLLLSSLVVWGLVRPAFEVKSWRGMLRAYSDTGLDVTASLLVMIVFFAMSSPKRWWPPYFILLYPFLAFALGLVAARFLERAQGALVAQFVAALVLGGLMTTWVGYMAHDRLKTLVEDRKKGAYQPALPEPVCDLFNQYSGPNDSVFIWGFDGDFYITCHRHPATRFTYLTLVAGTVPPYWKEIKPERQARDARKNMMADLEKSRPIVILNSPGTMRNVGLNVVPELVAFLKKNYCTAAPVTSKNGRKADVWIRNDHVSCRPGK